VQGKPVDIGGYYFPDRQKVSAAMRPSPTFNAALARGPGLTPNRARRHEKAAFGRLRVRGTPSGLLGRKPSGLLVAGAPWNHDKHKEKYWDGNRRRKLERCRAPERIVVGGRSPDGSSTCRMGWICNSGVDAGRHRRRHAGASRPG
jgi:hypothetical protein